MFNLCLIIKIAFLNFLIEICLETDLFRAELTLQFRRNKMTNPILIKKQTNHLYADNISDSFNSF